MPSVKPSFPRLRRDGHWSVKGLVAHYPFYEKAGPTLHDIAGNYDGTLTGMDAETDWVPSEMGAALTLSGNDQYISLPGWTLSGPWTVAVLARNEGLVNSVEMLFGDGSNDTDFFYARSGARQQFVNSAAAQADWIGDTDTLNRWRSYVLVADTTGVTLYLDGISQGRVVMTPSLSLQELGSSHTSADLDFEGPMAYAMLYLRGLSASEVAYLSAFPDIVYEPGGMPWLGAGAGLQVSPTGIASAEAFGAHQLNLILAASGITSAEALGSPQLALQILAEGIASAEAIGDPIVGLFVITPTGIVSAEAFGATLVGVPPDGLLYVNLADKKLRLYADGAWHDVYTW